MFKFFSADLWTIWGFLAQFLFFFSFVVQWYKSEKRKESHLPIEFWYLRMIASVMLFFYVLQRRDIVFFVSLLFQVILYGRNIYIIKNTGNAAIKNERSIKSEST